MTRSVAGSSNTRCPLGGRRSGREQRLSGRRGLVVLLGRPSATPPGLRRAHLKQRVQEEQRWLRETSRVALPARRSASSAGSLAGVGKGMAQEFRTEES